MPGTAAKLHVGAPIPFARTSAFAPFVSFLDTIGAPTERLLNQAHIPPMLLNDPEALVPLFPVYRFIELAVCNEHLDDLGIVVGQQASAFELGAFGQMLKGASNVYEYLQTGIRLIGALSRGTRFWLSTDGDVVRVNQYLTGPSSLGRCVADVYTLAITVSMLRRFIGPAWSPGEVRLLVGDEALLGDRNVLGEAALITSQRHSSFTISRSLMKLPVPGGGAGWAQSKDISQGEGQSMPVDLLASAEQLIVSLLGDGYPSVEAAAEAICMSPRTLQRRLADSGVTYSSLVASSRIRLARDWLTTPDIPITDIAAMLGYKEASNFSRAFRRQTGMSPQAYRHSQAPG